MATVRTRRRRLLCMLCLCPLLAHGDGMKFPPASVDLYPKIPSQRALITFRDGVESLTIESSYDGEGESFGWIVPVPATPTAIEEGSSGAVSSISGAVQPWIVSEVMVEVSCTATLLALSVGLSILLVAPSRRWGFAFCLIVCVAIFSCMLEIPRYDLLWSVFHYSFSLGEPGSSSMDVTVEMIDVAGDLEVSVLRAGSPEDLNAWLDQNGYKGLPPKGFAIAQDYIEDGWRFCAAKERRGLEGTSRTHALRIVFPATQPVYPMRLTALAQNEVDLQLLVVTDSSVEVPGMEAQAVRRFKADTWNWGTVDEQPAVAGRLPCMVTNSKRGKHCVGHPRALADMWDGCVVTHLRGAIKPDDMDRDIIPQFGDGREFGRTYWGHFGVIGRALNWAFISFPVSLTIMLLLFYRPSHAAWRRRWVALGALAAAIVVWIAVWQGILAWTPTIERYRPNVPYRAPLVLAELEALRDGEAGRNLRELFPESRAAVEVEEAALRVLTRYRLEEGDGPSQYEMWFAAEDLWIRLYDVYGFAKEIRMGPSIPAESADALSPPNRRGLPGGYPWVAIW